jgi:hypothetical protein
MGHRPVEKTLFPQMGYVKVVRQNVVDRLGISPRIWTIGGPERPRVAEGWLSKKRHVRARRSAPHDSRAARTTSHAPIRACWYSFRSGTHGVISSTVGK